MLLLDQHPPKSAKACAGYLKDRLRQVLADAQIYPMDSDDAAEMYQQHYTEIFFPRLLIILRRIAAAPDGAVPVVDLCIYTKLDQLHARSFPFFDGEAHQLANREIDNILAEALRSIGHEKRQPVTCDEDVQTPQPDAAYLCRSIRRFCDHFDLCEHHDNPPSQVRARAKRGCVRVNTAVALDLLQRHAYTEVKFNVYRAVGKKLPKELADHVLQYTLRAQGLPLEPGIFGSDGKATIKCEHNVYESASFEVTRAELR